MKWLILEGSHHLSDEPVLLVKEGKGEGAAQGRGTARSVPVELKYTGKIVLVK